jgi:hypothetical protein
MIASLGVMALIIAAVALLTAGIIALYKHLYKKTPEGKLKAA